MELDALVVLAALLLFVGALAVIVLDPRPAGAKAGMALFLLAAVCAASYSRLTANGTGPDCDGACMVGAFPETEDVVLSRAQSD